MSLNCNSLFAVGMCILLCGCCGASSKECWYRNQVPWGYVLAKGTAAKITQWTLEQDQEGRIDDGRTALLSILELRGETEACDAVQGLLALDRKLQTGWPSPEMAAKLRNQLLETAHMMARVGTSTVHHVRLADQLEGLHRKD